MTTPAQSDGAWWCWQHLNEPKVPSCCHRIIYPPVAAFLFNRIDRTWIKFKVLEIKDRKHDVCTDYFQEKKNDEESTTSGISCNRYVHEREACRSWGQACCVPNSVRRVIYRYIEATRGYGSYLLVYDVGFRKLVEQRDLADGEDINGKVDFLLVVPPCNVWTDRNSENSGYDVLTSEDMSDIAKMLGDWRRQEVLVRYFAYHSSSPSCAKISYLNLEKGVWVTLQVTRPWDLKGRRAEMLRSSRFLDKTAALRYPPAVCSC